MFHVNLIALLECFPLSLKVIHVNAGCSAELGKCPVLILAGGFGTRLRSAYKDGPKVLAPVHGRPFLWYLLASLANSGFRRVILCTGYRSEEIEQRIAAGPSFGLEITCSREQEAMGTAGALRLAHSRYAAGQRFFALNGDSLLKLDFRQMYEYHTNSGAEATVALAVVPNTSRYGSVEADERGTIYSFKEKDAGQTSGYINAGIYLFEPSVMDLVLEDRAVSLEREVLPLLVDTGLKAFRSSDFFIDIGTPEDFLRAQAELKELIP